MVRRFVVAADVVLVTTDVVCFRVDPSGGVIVRWRGDNVDRCDSTTVPSFRSSPSPSLMLNTDAIVAWDDRGRFSDEGDFCVGVVVADAFTVVAVWGDFSLVVFFAVVFVVVVFFLAETVTCTSL